MQQFWKTILEIIIRTIKLIYKKILLNQVPVQITKENNKQKNQEAQKFKTAALEVIQSTLNNLSNKNSKKFKKIKLEFQNDSKARKLTLEFETDNPKKEITNKEGLTNENNIDQETTNFKKENHQ